MTSLRIDLPAWLADVAPPTHTGDDARMAFVLDLVDRQVDAGTGGPFAAAVFGGTDGGLMGIGVNRVEAASACIAHAEVVALAVAGQAVGSFTLVGHDAVLVASTEPCAMCLGAVGWSGVTRLVCGATDADARSVGFDEGDKPSDWTAGLAARGIEVATEVLRPRAAAALSRYVEVGGTLYNP